MSAGLCIEGKDFPVGGDLPTQGPPCLEVIFVDGTVRTMDGDPVETVTVPVGDTISVGNTVPMVVEDVRPIVESDDGGQLFGWVAVLIGLVGVGVCIAVTLAVIKHTSSEFRSTVGARTPRRDKDPQRTFTPEQKRQIVEAAGGVCEWIDPRTGETCTNNEDLEADHIFPHTFGGKTVVGNGAALCHRHNRIKGKTVMPEEWVRAVLERRKRHAGWGRIIEAQVLEGAS